MLRAAAQHKGASLVEIYQNCNIFNDGAFDLLKNPETRDEALIRLEPGEPITFAGGTGPSSATATAGCARPTPPRSTQATSWSTIPPGSRP